MHLRASQARGLPVIDDGSQQTVGFLDEPLLDPDTGRILGFFVLPAFFGEGQLFLQCADITSWGARVHIRNEGCLSPPQDLIRLQQSLTDTRTVIGQSIRYKTSRKSLGVCADVQFNTRHFMTEWIFPRKFFISRQPLPISDVLEVTDEAIWVRDPIRTVPEETVPEEQVKPTVLSDVVPQVQTCLLLESERPRSRRPVGKVRR